MEKSKIKNMNINAHPLFKKYPYILAWGQMMGSFKYFIEAECEKAEKDGAPETACYQEGNRKTGVWKTVDNMRPALKEELDEYLTGVRGGLLHP